MARLCTPGEIFMRVYIKRELFLLQWTAISTDTWHCHGYSFCPKLCKHFMSLIEQNILSTAPEGKIPLIWKRFIDDIFMIWQYDEASLTEFLAHTNNVHNRIKLEAQQSKAKINSLDTTIYRNNNSGLLESTIFVKPTDICTLLHAKSFHPPSCKKVLFTAKHFASDV